MHDHENTTDAPLAEMLDLDGEVLHAYWADALDWVRQEAPATGRVLDVGAGSGTGTLALAERFPAAEVVAVDVSAEMLARIRAKSPRVRTVRADLDEGWPALDPVDVAWASMSLHHVADPDRVLRDLHRTVRPGGLVAVAEFAEPLRFLPYDLGVGRPGLEDRCLATLGTAHAPEIGAHWAPRLERAGFADPRERTFTIALDAPHPPATARYARRWLERLRTGVADRLDHDDRHTLAALLDGDGPASVDRRGDLRVRGERTVTLARRPPVSPRTRPEQ
jgi:SAM-dependent methyltransferase